jgi:electron transfer flavoprotein alpha subunit
MAEVLVLIDHSEGTIKKVSLELLAMAAGIGEPSAVFVGPGADAALATLVESVLSLKSKYRLDVEIKTQIDLVM